MTTDFNIVRIVGAPLDFNTLVPNQAQLLRGWSSFYYDSRNPGNPFRYWILKADKSGFEPLNPATAPGTADFADLLGSPSDNDALQAALDQKPSFDDLNQAVDVKYSLPPTGMPSTDMSASVQAALVAASSALTSAVLTVAGRGYDGDGNVALVKGDIGLGSVDNTSDAAKNSAAVILTNKKVKLSKALGANLDWQGEAMTGFVSGAAITLGQLIYIGAGGTLLVATSATTTNPCRGMALASVGSGAAVDYLEDGVVRNDAWTWQAGGDLYLGAAGALTQAVPSGAGVKTQKVGYALSATVIRIIIGQANFVAG